MKKKKMCSRIQMWEIELRNVWSCWVNYFQIIQNACPCRMHSYGHFECSSMELHCMKSVRPNIAKYDQWSRLWHGTQRHACCRIAFILYSCTDQANFLGIFPWTNFNASKWISFGKQNNIFHLPYAYPLHMPSMPCDFTDIFKLQAHTWMWNCTATNDSSF